MFYSGIDLHKDNCVISTVNQAGKMIKQSKLPNHNNSIIRYFSGMGKPHKAVVESTANWYCLSDLLRENGITPGKPWRLTVLIQSEHYFLLGSRALCLCDIRDICLNKMKALE